MIVRHRYSTPTNFDRAFEQLTRSFLDTANRPAGPALRANWVDESYVLTADLPGVPADAVTVESVGNELRIAVNSDELKFERKLRLHDKLDVNKVSARHVDGRLTVSIGQVDAPEARSIAIDTEPASAAIEASSEDASDSDEGEGNDE